MPSPTTTSSQYTGARWMDGQLSAPPPAPCRTASVGRRELHPSRSDERYQGFACGSFFSPAACRTSSCRSWVRPVFADTSARR